MNQDERRCYLIDALQSERTNQGVAPVPVPPDVPGQRSLLRALMNVRPPTPVDADILAMQDAYLNERLRERGGAVDAATLPTVDASDPVRSRISLWRGDITLLAVDAIVNAANSQLLGCFVPGHHCIDNAIHTFAGMQLRLACTELMQAQGHEEPPGRVKVTPAFNLPSALVFHTVGPIVQDGKPTARDRTLLASCYRSCLEEARRRNLDTLAFCCISTGLFGFPQREAACVAIETVIEHLTHRDSNLKVIFDVFVDADKRIYQELLCGTR